MKRVIVWDAYGAEISELIDSNIVARKSFIPATESTTELSALNPATKVALVVAGNEGNSLLKK